MGLRKRLAAGLLAIAVLALIAGSASALELKRPLPEITLIGDTGEVDELAYQAIQEMLRVNLGFEIEMHPIPFQNRLQRMRNRDFDIVYAAWLPDYNDPQTYLDLWVTGNEFNRSDYSNADYDAAMDIVHNSTDPERRFAAMAEAEQVIADQFPIIPLYWRYSPIRQRDYVKGIVDRAVGTQLEWKWAYTEGRPSGDDFQYLNLVIGSEPPDLDPTTMTDNVSMLYANATLDGLMRPGSDGAIKKGSALATDWTISEDGTVYTFTLRDAEWSDGVPITAHDFVYSWRRAVDPRTAAQYANMFTDYIANAEAIHDMDPDDPNLNEALTTLGVKALDDHTLQVTLKQPSAVWLGLTSFSVYLPVPKHMVEKLGDDYASEASRMLASGPFVVTRWDHDYQLVLEKNPHYWDADNVTLDRIHTSMVADAGARQNLYDTGVLDRVGVSGAYIDIYRDELSDPIPDGAVNYLQLNMNNEFLANVNIRRAIAYAIDRTVLTDRIFRNGYKPATSYVPPIMPDAARGGPFTERVGEIIPPEGDVELAKKYWKKGLEELGYL